MPTKTKTEKASAAPDKTRPDTEQCSDCEYRVSENDPYFATPCGTFCSDCMEKRDGHADRCGVCASEFDLAAGADDGDGYNWETYLGSAPTHE